MNKESLQKIFETAIDALENGGVILYPADTIWGIGCDPLNQEAIRKIYDIKGRDERKPLILLVPDIPALYQVVSTVHPRIETLLSLHQRPLTVVYPKTKLPYKHLAAADGSIGVRVVNNGICHEFLLAYGKPLISTSANISGTPSPVKFGAISSEILRQMDYVFPAPLEKDCTGTPSVIARYDANGELDFIRTNA